MNKKFLIVIFSIILFFLLVYFLIPTDEVILEEETSLAIYFCPQDNCENILVHFLDSAEESIHCALFDIGLESVQEKLLKKQIEVQVVTDNQYAHKFDYDFVQEDSWGLMHNKFCVVDDKKVITGSMNPTENGAYKNNNNLILLESVAVAQNYETEFQELWTGTFKSGEQVQDPIVLLGETVVETYFCPDDYCAYRVKEELKKAEQSIHFMTFSFTHEGIANVLMLKHLDGVEIHGVMEARQVTKFSQFSRLEFQGIDVIKDGNKNNMHHKVFIIDGKTVITGSFNPTNGGNENNDENLLIIRDKDIADLFLEEFEKVYREAKLFGNK